MQEMTPQSAQNKPISTEEELLSLHDIATEGEADDWMLTFADLLSLLLAFFILMYSMTTLQTNQWSAVSASLKEYLNPVRMINATTFTTRLGIESFYLPQAQELDYLYTILEEKVKSDPVMQRYVHIQRTEGRLVISVPGETFFNPENTTLTNNAQVILFAIGNALQSVGNRIEVYGTAARTSSELPDSALDWEVALTRAVIVSEELKKYGYAYTIPPYGLVDSRYRETIHESSVPRPEQEKLTHQIDIVVRETVATP